MKTTWVIEMRYDDTEEFQAYLLFDSEACAKAELDELRISRWASFRLVKRTEEVIKI